jgi:Na+-transporting NADH:ubiquinone oxidoreductase subunit NqrB
MMGLTRSRWSFQGVDLNLAESSNGMTTSQQWFNLASLKSALITGLGLCLLLRANHFSTMLLAAGLAIASKFIFRVRGKHFFNPANFGIIAVLALTKDAWVSPGQWGTDWWYLALFLATGGLVLKKVGRWETSAVFLAVYTSLEALRNVWLGWDSEVLLHHLSSGSLLVFALFMLTDPRSIPNAVKSRIIWAMSIAILTFVLQYTLYLQTAMFWALFCLSPLTILLDSHYFFPRFTWLKSNSLSLPLNS